MTDWLKHQDELGKMRKRAEQAEAEVDRLYEDCERLVTRSRNVEAEVDRLRASLHAHCPNCESLRWHLGQVRDG